jgi:hypothetical protein
VSLQNVVARILPVASLEGDKGATEIDLSPGLGSRFMDEFEDAIRRLSRAPNEQPPWLAEGVPRGVRHTLFQRFPFHLIFILDPSPLIVATRAQRQDPLDWLERLAT